MELESLTLLILRWKYAPKLSNESQQYLINIHAKHAAKQMTKQMKHANVGAQIALVSIKTCERQYFQSGRLKNWGASLRQN